VRSAKQKFCASDHQAASQLQNALAYGKAGAKPLGVERFG